MVRLKKLREKIQSRIIRFSFNFFSHSRGLHGKQFGNSQADPAHVEQKAIIMKLECPRRLTVCANKSKQLPITPIIWCTHFPAK